jgi:hypothetical protein
VAPPPPPAAEVRAAPGSDRSDLRKLTITMMVFQGFTMLAALATATFTGYIAYVLYTAIASMSEAIKQSGI